MCECLVVKHYPILGFKPLPKCCLRIYTRTVSCTKPLSTGSGQPEYCSCLHTITNQISLRLSGQCQSWNSYAGLHSKRRAGSWGREMSASFNYGLWKHCIRVWPHDNITAVMTFSGTCSDTQAHPDLEHMGQLTRLHHSIASYTCSIIATYINQFNNCRYHFQCTSLLREAGKHPRWWVHGNSVSHIISKHKLWLVFRISSTILLLIASGCGLLE